MKKILGGCLIALISFVLICILLLFGLKACIRGRYLSKEQIFDVVNKKYDVIMTDIQKGDFTKTERIRCVDVIPEEDGVIEFSCGGIGNVASGVYYGFYYTEDDLPKVSFLNHVFFDEEDLVPDGKGYCFDQYDYYYTEKIRDNFYYYESHY